MQAVHHKIQPCQLIGQHGGGVLLIAEHHDPLVSVFHDHLDRSASLLRPVVSIMYWSILGMDSSTAAR